MANSLTSRDAYVLMNSIAAQATGQTSLTAVDTTTFVSVGETLLRTAAENTLSAISTVLADTIFSVRPYKGKLESLKVAQRRWGAQVRKVVNLYSEAEASEDWNTDLNATQLADGSSVDMYTIKAPKAIQLNFYGTTVLQKHVTRFRDQLAIAFRDEAEFIRFIEAVMVEFNNEIELLNEQKTRLTLINFMAGLYDMNIGNVVDLVADYNSTYSTTYTRDDLLTTYLQEFMKFISARIKTDSNKLTDYTSLYHANLTGYNAILRHTPKERQKMLMFDPIFTRAESEVYSGLFNPQYLDIGTFEGVNFWQDPSTPASITCKPNELDVATGQSVDAAAAVGIDFVLGLLYDEEALGVMPQFDYASTTPFNSAGGYYNMYMHGRFNAYNDYTENAILYVLGAGGS